MTKRNESKYKIDRRMGENIWGRPKSPVNRREYGPGQHGQRRNRTVGKNEEIRHVGPQVAQSDIAARWLPEGPGLTGLRWQSAAGPASAGPYLGTPPLRFDSAGPSP